MAYSTQDDVRIAVGGTRNLIELADLEDTNSTDGGAAVALVVGKAIAEADGYINSYLKQRLAVPLAIVPPEISAMSSSWAARVLRRGRYKAQPISEDQESEKIDREWLMLVAKGEIQLGLEPTPAPSSIIIDKAAPRDPSLVVSKRKLQGFI